MVMTMSVDSFSSLTKVSIMAVKSGTAELLDWSMSGVWVAMRV